MSSSDSRNWTALKGIALAATFSLASAQQATSLFFIPSLLRPLDQSREPIPSPSPSRQGSSLTVPTLGSTDGRLTPQPFESQTFNFHQASSGSYKAVAAQFSQLERAGAAAGAPLELFALGVFGIAAYRARNAGSSLWTHWAAAAALVGALLPASALAMKPLVIKVRRLAGEEEKIEPYEDAPIDREAEKSNTVEFVKGWAVWNLGRSAVLYAATGLGAWALLGTA